MANEALLRNRLEDPIDFTVADGTGIEKGAALALNDPRTAIVVSAVGAAASGIAAREKIAGDGRTQLSVFVRGIFDMVASGAVAIGNPLAFSGDSNAGDANKVIKAPATVSGLGIIGHAFEAASDAETFQVYLNVGAGSSGVS